MSENATSGTKRQLKNTAEVSTSGKHDDIRGHGVNGEPLVHSAGAQIKRELKGAEYPTAAHDKELHADTTDLSDKASGGVAHNNTSQSGEPFTPSAKKRIAVEVKHSSEL